MNPVVKKLIDQHRLPDTFVETVSRYYLPLAAAIAREARARKSTLLVGVNGAQGTGKSTLASFLGQLLFHEFQLRAVEISIDDLYLSKAERQSLAEDVHPLLAVRGVPGTHDVKLGVSVLEKLASATSGEVTVIPRFDKAVDDRCAESQWTQVQGRPDVIILEGWCVGARAQPEAWLRQPVNSLEAKADAGGQWRHFVNDQLAGPYENFFDLLDFLVMIRAPSFSCVYEWRLLQEEKLRQSRIRQGLSTEAVMSPAQVADFIMCYERLTAWQLQEMPGRADALFEMDKEHQITELTGRLLVD